MATKYNPYSDIQKVYDAKVAWNNAKTDEERKTQNAIATAARNKLTAYGYGDVVKQISADGADATATRKIMEQYAPKPVTEQGTNTSTVTPVKNTVETNNLKSAEINRENAGLFDKYNATYDDLTKTNPFTTEEAKAILAKYDLAGLQGRDNAVASGGASNGGNIDSYASANAMRQQAALVNQGQMAVLEAHKQKIDNVRGLLSDMGVNIDRVFNQDETAKNNDVARKSEIASVTGYVPTEWTYDNNIYLNKDGSVKDEFLTEEFDNTGGFTTIINNAKAKLATTTDAKERANLQTTINAATQAKALKTFSSPKYSKYAHEVQGVTPQITEARRESEQSNDTILKTLGIESADKRYEIDANKYIKAADNATDIAVADIEKAKPTLTASQAATAIKSGEISQSVIDAYNYYYGTNYTVDNPPKLGDNTVNDGIYVDDDDNTDDTSGENKNKDIFTKWEDDGITFKTFTVKGPADENKLKSAGVDKHGQSAIESVYKAVANDDLGIDGTVSNYDLAEYLISQSDINNTNKDQLKKVFAYFGLDKNMLEQVEDSGFWFWQWGQGTNYKN